MNVTNCFSYADYDIEWLQTFFSQSTIDLYDNYVYQEKSLTLQNGATIVVNSQVDERRSANPLLLDPNTGTCFFCDYVRCNARDTILLSPDSFLYKPNNQLKILMVSTKCGPEPTIQHFIDMCILSDRLKPVSTLTVINMPGSGASIPQHFHTQIWPKKGSLGRLFDNFQCSRNPFSVSDQVSLREIRRPMWGIELTFDEVDPVIIGKRLYEATQLVRYKAQLHLSYNIYIDSARPKSILIIFRESWKECPFQLYELQAIIENIISTDKARAVSIRESDNANWRWGWSECMGGMSPRDTSFDDFSIFNDLFWQRIYNFMDFDPRYRDSLSNSIIEFYKKDYIGA